MSTWTEDGKSLHEEMVLRTLNGERWPWWTCLVSAKFRSSVWRDALRRHCAFKSDHPNCPCPAERWRCQGFKYDMKA